MPLAKLSLHSSARTLGLGVALTLLMGSVQAASAPSQQFQQWSGERWVTRSVSLVELGLTTPAVLDNSNGQREFYLPVPADVRLSEAALQLNGRYLRADGGRTTVTVSIDGYPVAARRLNDDQGDASQSIPVDGVARAGGFVRVGINWSSVLSDMVCTDQRAPGNSLKIDPSTRFSYKYERAAITTVVGAWNALPLRPVMLVAGAGMTAQAYDTAWRTGVAIERAGRHATVLSLPQVGATIDLSHAEVPATLRTVPAFAALAEHNPRHVLKDAAQLGALLLLGEHGPLHADLVITDPALLTAVRTALDALGAQVAGAAPDAVAAYNTLVAANFSVLTTASPDNLRLAQFGGLPTIAVPSSSVAKTATLLGTLWKPTAQGQNITTTTVQSPRLDGDILPLSRFGAITGSFDVLGRSERSVVVDLGAVGADGRLPDRLTVDVSAAPSINGEAPIVSLFVNNYLLGAEKVTANGTPQRLDVAIPRYALTARNEVRVAFLRQPTQVRCHDTPMAYPVAILPGSQLHFAKADGGNDFVGMAGKFADGASLMLPDSWLAQPATSLPLVIRMADAAGLSVEKSTLQLVPQGQAAKPDAAFLALDVAPAGYSPGSAPRSGRLVLRGHVQSAQLDISGVDHLATAELIRTGGQQGIVFQNIGKQSPLLATAFRLGRGNLAVFNDTGPVLQLESEEMNGTAPGRSSGRWELGMLIWVSLGVLFVLLLIAARIANVRRRKAQSRQG
ncbi:cellulose biosynthesis cyclic di-GMP-binding regulatory protein BcsB [Duganella aquatilis]|nr:cellulose biosynthesis cyclic di-GMP-binding regulatory protein BcsB [Duganella aquatilis]